ncbi:MAG: manganese efflux pump MntP family protein [Bacteroidales bacterium]|nr:manganese efflux pump MntP family protein [Bacteroidales bacterium]MDD4670635.1 manganese efflux pump MntP family protein [Bacteroidales bacterium]
MSFLEIVLLAVGLSFDTLAVSLAGGACISKIDFWRRVKILISFALFQAGFTFVGWGLGSSVSQYIDKYDHWVAFILLAYIGGKMVIDSFRSSCNEDSVDLLNTKKLVLASIATSIDALAVGISLSMLQMSLSRILYSLLIIGFITALASEIGLRGGAKLGKCIGPKSNLIGGIILLAIGIKILIEHLVV